MTKPITAEHIREWLRKAGTTGQELWTRTDIVRTAQTLEALRLQESGRDTARLSALPITPSVRRAQRAINELRDVLPGIELDIYTNWSRLELAPDWNPDLPNHRQNWKRMQDTKALVNIVMTLEDYIPVQPVKDWWKEYARAAFDCFCVITKNNAPQISKLPRNACVNFVEVTLDAGGFGKRGRGPIVDVLEDRRSEGCWPTAGTPVIPPIVIALDRRSGEAAPRGDEARGA